MSKHAARIIQQFAGAHLADSLEAAGDDEEEHGPRERPPVDMSWVSLSTVHDLLQRTTSTEKSQKHADDTGKASKFSHQIEGAKCMSEKLWPVPAAADSMEGTLDRRGHIAALDNAGDAGGADHDLPEKKEATDADAHMVYRGFTVQRARAWLRTLHSPHRKMTPSEEQEQCIKCIVDRCIAEDVGG